MKNVTLSAFAAVALLAVSACKEPADPGVDFAINFKATYDSSQLEKNKPYNFDATQIVVQRYRLYLSDIALIKDTTVIPVTDVVYLDFTPDQAASDLSTTPRIVFSGIPAGEYDGIRIGFGVNAANNAKQPSDFPAGSPLAYEIDYWLGWRSYIFTVLDGRMDSDKDGVMDLPYSYHCGSDPVYRVFTFTQHIHVEEGHPELNVEFDIRKLLLNDNGTYYDILANNATSNLATDTRVAEDISSHYDTATTIKQ